MKNLIVRFLSLIIIPYSLFAQTHPNPETLKPGDHAIDFNLEGVDGKMYSLSSFNDAKILVIIFSAPHCPTAQVYEQRIIDVQKDYKDKGVQVVMINPNSPEALCLEEMAWTDLGDTFEDMKIRAKEKEFNFPFLNDSETEETSMKYGPVATPHCFVFDNDRILRYVGRVDEAPEIELAKQHDLRNAIDAVLAGNEVEVKQTKVFGCSIKWKWKDEARKKLDAEWLENKVSLETLSVDQMRELLKNDSKKLRVINVWATWCGPCVAEFSELIDTYRMFMVRDFEMFTISTDKPDSKDNVLEFLQKKNAAITGNYIFGSQNKYDLIENLDPEWSGEIPYTVIVEPGGEIVWRNSGNLDFYQFRKAIVDNRLIGRGY